ncbi:MAG: hypothetical protein KDD12_06140 [Lewinella sp.]|nr:hypothetical protein [Lewinella sp.]
MPKFHKKRCFIWVQPGSRPKLRCQADPKQVIAEYHKFGVKDKKVSPESVNFYIKMYFEWMNTPYIVVSCQWAVGSWQLAVGSWQLAVGSGQ